MLTFSSTKSGFTLSTLQERTKKGADDSAPFLLLRSLFHFQRAHPAKHAIAWKQQIDCQRHQNANTGIQHAVKRIFDVGLDGSVEQNDAQHHAARLDRARPLKELRRHNEQHNADEQKQQQQRVHASLRLEFDISAEQHHAQNAAQNCAEQAVAAIEPGIAHVFSHAKDRADAGKGGIAAEREIEKCAERCGERGFEIAHADVKPEPRLIVVHDLPLKIQFYDNQLQYKLNQY